MFKGSGDRKRKKGDEKEGDGEEELSWVKEQERKKTRKGIGFNRRAG